MSVEVSSADRVAGPPRWWWLFLVTGIAWILFSMLILQLDLDAVRAIGYVMGIILMVAAAEEFAAVFMVSGWKWLRALLGILFLVAGVTALSWPGATTVVLSRIFAWYLLFKGTFDVVTSIVDRGHEYWWLGLIVGVLELGLAFWVVGYPGRSLELLLLWVGFASLCRGMLQIFLAFGIRKAGEDLGAGPPYAAA